VNIRLSSNLDPISKVSSKTLYPLRGSTLVGCSRLQQKNVKKISATTGKQMSLEGNICFLAEILIGSNRRKRAVSGPRTRINLRTSFLVSRAPAFFVSGYQTLTNPCACASTHH